MISSLIISLAFAYQRQHVPDSDSLKGWMTGTYEDRREIENQWQYEQKVIEQGERLERMEQRQREREREEMWEKANERSW
jgi:hypothetical protein